ncbi:MFS transporter [Sphingomonas sp. MMS12-HWE2-04]|uniref:MFS transporter n=1 Tax=Sphingomonas sp. MMS12-HWE2-04 TaxID=3234199 RepID=UPI003850FB8C
MHAASQSSGTVSSAERLFRLSIGIFFMGGFVTSLVSLLVPRLTLLDRLDYTRGALVQLAFHSSYLLFALPITALLVRLGYMRAMAAGLFVMTTGCLGLAGAAYLASYSVVLVALLGLSAGITFLQIAANVIQPVVEQSGRGASRLTLLQGFNSIGTVLAPLIGAGFLLGATDIKAGAPGWLMLALPFLACATLLLGLGLAFWRARALLAAFPAPRRLPLAQLRSVLGEPRLVFGAVAMFAYVGAEVTIGTLLANYLAQAEILGASPAHAGRLVSLYWGGAMIGRFAGAYGLTRWRPARLLATMGFGAVALVAVATQATGLLGATALLAVGLCNAIMYPTLFALSLPADRSCAPYASMVLCMAVVGGAVIPMLTAMLADRIGLASALGLPALCYCVIAAFALMVALTEQ